MKHLYILLFILPLIGFGQGWEQMFGGDEDDVGYSVQQTTDGGYIITGGTENNGQNIYLIKTNETGEEEWSQTFGNSFLFGGWGSSVQQTTDGGYIITGTIQGVGGNNDICLIKVDDEGTEEWLETFGDDDENDEGYSVQQTMDGGYIITGETQSFDVIENSLYLIKTNENGEEEWSQYSYGSVSEYGGQTGSSVQQTNDGGYIIGGSNLSESSESMDMYLIKTDNNGNEQWSQTFGGDYNDWGFSVQQTSDGGYIFTGYSFSFGNVDVGSEIYLIKTNEDGEEEWSQILGGVGHDFGYSVQQTTDGGYIITGYTESFNSINGDVYLLKTNENGEEEWSQCFGGSGYEEGYCVQQTIDGGYIITGLIESDFVIGQDVYLIKTDSQGNVTSTIELPTPKSKRELVKTTNILGQENTTIKNQPLIEIYDDGSVEKKCIIE